MSIGILAYGSLIEDPGVEIEPLIQEQITNVETPFSIEFARKSSTRGDAPTVIPVDAGGNRVLAMILVLKDCVSLNEAEDLLWRRETRKEGSGKHYTPPETPNPNKVVVEHLKYFEGVETVLYTKLGPNIDILTARNLASLAINSAKSLTVKSGMDGISYLMSIKRQNIETPLMPDYEKEILCELNADNLEDALSICKESK